MANPRDFVRHYTGTAEDRARVAFAWNGKHAEEFEDANYNFRRSVLRVVLADLHAAPIALVRDLYDAETAMAKEAWGVYAEAVRALAEELLTRGGPDYVEDFLAGKIGRGMDAYCSAFFECPRELAGRLLAEVERRLAAGADGERRQLLEAGREVFQWWVENARRP
jgi:hypothetical protein